MSGGTGDALSHSPAIRSALLHVAHPAPEGHSLVTRLLREQQDLTAVERFARRHEACALPAETRTYRDLVPIEKPRPGQQYAFEVDLDACTGCKACVAACHSLNGLDEGEVWRTVGLLHGGTPETPAQQTVTTSCHHCVDPACLSGCPVKAYEKDPVTGIVKHLDDQCIGCQYCILMCPYDAPKYNQARGIVRKCDMCSDRLATGEAPACVEACPSQAIRIAIIDTTQAVEASEAGVFLPGAPAPDATVPTTVYKTARSVPRNLLPADFYSLSPQHSHGSLVLMLVLTQLAVGAFLACALGKRAFGVVSGAWDVAQALVALLLAFTAIGAATFHLGRPLYAFRAVLGLRTSWMSREILCFGIFAALSTLYALSLLPVAHLAPTIATVLGGARGGLEVGAAAFGILGVLCSAMIYAVTRRSHWQGAATTFKFVASTVALGAAAVHGLGAWLAATGDASLSTAAESLRRLALVTLVLAATAKLLYEASVLRHLGGRQHTVMKRVALLMVRDLHAATLWRFLTGAAGGLVIPLVALRTSLGPTQTAVASTAMLALLFAGEILERYLFFRAAPASRMPGALA